MICSLGLAPMANLSMCNIYARPVLSHLSQFRGLPADLQRCEPFVLARLLATPSSAIPIELLQRLDIVGTHPSYMSLATYSTSTRFRAACTSPAFWRSTNELDTFVGSDDALTKPPREWLDSSILSEMENAYDEVIAISPQLERVTQNHQRGCSKALLQHCISEEDVFKAVVHRI